MVWPLTLEAWAFPGITDLEHRSRACERPIHSPPGTVVQIGREPRRSDFLTAIDGVGFAEACGAKKEILVDGLTIPVIGRDDFLKNKRATGRLKDLADAERFESEAT